MPDLLALYQFLRLTVEFPLYQAAIIVLLIWLLLFMLLFAFWGARIIFFFRFFIVCDNEGSEMVLDLIQLIILCVEVCQFRLKVTLFLTRGHRFVIYLHQHKVAVGLLHYLVNMSDLLFLRLRLSFNFILQSSSLRK